MRVARASMLPIERDDRLMAIDEGVAEAAAFLKGILIREPKPGGEGEAPAEPLSR